MLNSSENEDALTNETILSQAKDLLDRLIVAVDILADGTANANCSNLEDVLSQFDEALLDSEGNSFSDAHPTTGQGRSLDSLLKNEEPRPQLDVVQIDSAWDVPPFNYQTIDDIERVESSQQQVNPYLNILKN
ncbi:hypothetical protein CDAR_457851 [Caerostris darwini]|uniref:Uncharacterized protein n=1 Tax=Caerostris darwini TaxID=1538125 RepID=A0AAV4V8G9_9ARAC|nr:hypothetical protein CDAR_457851 [Caerostris darwini]